MWRSYRVPKTGQIIKKSSTYQMVMANSVALSSRVWMNPFSLKMLATRHTRDGFDILNPKTGQRTKADLDTLIIRHVKMFSVVVSNIVICNHCPVGSIA